MFGSQKACAVGGGGVGGDVVAPRKLRQLKRFGSQGATEETVGVSKLEKKKTSIK